MDQTNQTALLLSLLILALGLAACACQPNPAFQAADEATAPGQRLWYLGLKVAKGSAESTDALVAIPLLRALEKDGRVQVIGALTTREWCLIYLRSPVSTSSLQVVEAALGQVRLPNGSGQPAFAAAGPPGPNRRSLNLGPGAMPWFQEGLGLLGCAADAARLASDPDRFRLRKRSRFSWALRVEAPDPAALKLALAAQHASLGEAKQLPGPETILRLSPKKLAAYLTGDSGKARPAQARACAQMPDGERALLGWPIPATDDP